MQLYWIVRAESDVQLYVNEPPLTASMLHGLISAVELSSVLRLEKTGTILSTVGLAYGSHRVRRDGTGSAGWRAGAGMIVGAVGGDASGGGCEIRKRRKKDTPLSVGGPSGRFGTTKFEECASCSFKQISAQECFTEIVVQILRYLQSLACVYPGRDGIIDGWSRNHPQQFVCVQANIHMNADDQ